MHLLFGGGGGYDLNLIFDSEQDNDGGNPRLKIQSLSKLISMMSENELCDIFLGCYPDVKRFTWRNKNPFIQRRLDYFILSEGLQDSIEIMDIMMNNGHSSRYFPLEREEPDKAILFLLISLFLHWKYYLYRLEIIAKFMELKLTTSR